MREVLFRGKCIDETCLKGKWLEGDILHDGVTGKYYINTGNCLNESDIVGEEGLLRFVAYEVDPETVCQYTGLTDKNGRKIFEGDIVLEHKNTYIAFWDCCNHEIGIKNNKESLGIAYVYPGDMKVIGNIFDNPDLLKE